MTLSDAELAFLEYLWPYNARVDQLAPDYPGHPKYKTGWRFLLALAGRGWGKSRSGAEWVREKKNNCGFIALLGETAADVRDVMVEGPSGIIATSPPWDKPRYEPSKRKLTWPNGAIAKTYSGDDPEQLRGPQHTYAWCDELAKFRYAEEAWNQLRFGLRLAPKDGGPTQAFITTTPKPVPILKKIVNHPKTHVVKRPTYDNFENLSGDFIDDLMQSYEGSRLGQQEIHAEMLEEAEGALWSMATIEAGRVMDEKPDDFYRETAIGLDPQASMQRSSTGIVAVSRGSDGHGYVRGDSTGNLLPGQWARRAVELYYQMDADVIVAEGNQGGEMVKAAIHNYDKDVIVKMVRARHGKQARASPVAALYEQGRIHHVGYFGPLESQMVTWEPESGDASPDRIDALVWACHHLLVRPVRSRDIGGAPSIIEAA